MSNKEQVKDVQFRPQKMVFAGFNRGMRRDLRSAPHITAPMRGLPLLAGSACGSIAQQAPQFLQQGALFICDGRIRRRRWVEIVEQQVPRLESDRVSDGL